MLHQTQTFHVDDSQAAVPVTSSLLISATGDLTGCREAIVGGFLQEAGRRCATDDSWICRRFKVGRPRAPGRTQHPHVFAGQHECAFFLSRFVFAFQLLFAVIFYLGSPYGRNKSQAYTITAVNLGGYNEFICGACTSGYVWFQSDVFKF